MLRNKFRQSFERFSRQFVSPDLNNFTRTNNDEDDVGNQTVSGAFSSVLQMLNVSLVPFDACKEKPIFKNISPTKHICAGGEEGRRSF